MKIYVVGDPVRSTSDAVGIAVDWWASASGTQEPDYSLGLDHDGVEFIRSLIEVRPGPGDSLDDVEGYQKYLQKRAIEHAREKVAEARSMRRRHTSSSLRARRVGADWRKYRRDYHEPGRKFVRFRVYHCPDGVDPEWVADTKTLTEAREYAHRKDGGIQRYLWDTLRAARDPDGPPMDFQYEDPEPMEWIGDYCIVSVFETPPKQRHDYW
jgi:hypothetical protein